MKEQITYKEFIDNIIKTRGQWNIPQGEYYEAHHILPKCMGGAPNTYHHSRRTIHENIIWLYPEEHYQAHELLALENPDNFSLVSAWNRMACNEYGEYISQENYAILREQFSKLDSVLHKGKKLSDEAKEKLSKFNKGKLVSESTREKLREAAKNRKPMSQEQKDYLSRLKTGQPTHKTRPILCIETNKVYPMLSQAAKELGIQSSGICRCLKYPQNTCGGYHWRYLK